MNKKLTSEPFGSVKPIKIDLSIQPYIESEIIKEERRTWLRFDIVINSQHINQLEPIAYFCIADGEHEGEQNGPKWEQLQVHWLKQYDYLKKHIESATAQATVYFCGEACVPLREDWNLETLLSESIMTELDEWANRHVSDHDKSGAWTWGRQFRFHPVQLVSFYARAIWGRLTGTDKPYAEIKWRVGYFSESQYDQVLSRYKQFANNWREARKIYVRNRINWKEEVLETYGFIPDYLLDDLIEKASNKRWLYKPGRIALVHLAWDARIRAKDGSIIQMSHFSSLLRTLNDYADAKGKPRVKIEENEE